MGTDTGTTRRSMCGGGRARVASGDVLDATGTKATGGCVGFGARAAAHCSVGYLVLANPTSEWNLDWEIKLDAASSRAHA